MDTTSLILLCTLIPAGVILILILMRIFYFNSPKNKETSDIKGKIIIVTGSTSGVGKLTAIELLKQGATVVMACRNKLKTEQVMSTITANRDNAHFIQLDLGDYNSIIRFSEEFKTKFGRCDILINNAGCINESYGMTNNMESTFMCNTVGPILFTALLLDCIPENGRVINISSYTVFFVNETMLKKFLSDRIYKNSYKGFESYSLSKIGNLYHAQHLEEYFNKKGMEIKTCAIHPGSVATDLPQGYKSWFARFVYFLIYPFFWYLSKTLYMGAQTTLYCVHVDYDRLRSGGYFMDCKEKKLSGIRVENAKMMEYMDYTKKRIYENFPDVPDSVREYLEYLKN
jgi:retinol dehydrogenase-12